MINGVNSAVDFTFAKESKTSISPDFPQARSEFISVYQYAYKPERTMTAINVSKAKDFKINEAERIQPSNVERVQVQRLQTHAQLRNNKWNYQNFYSQNAVMEPVLDVTYNIHNHINKYNTNSNNNKNNSSNNNNNNNNINNYNNNNKNIIIIENKSALNKCNMEKPAYSTATTVDSHRSDIDVMLKCDKITSDIITSNDKRSNCYRTEDQENAFRRIEDVHNYAKLKRYGNSNESSDGSAREYDDDEEDDDVDGDGDGDGDGDDDVDDVNDDVVGDDEDDDVDDDVELRNVMNNELRVSVNKKQNINHGATNNCHSNIESPIHAGKNFTRTTKKSSSTEDTDAIVDVETITAEGEQPLMQSPPAHHARRPMNAFLIFCKRHRAIVKDRNKSLENRAITKILGDWWASLDNDEKDCFTKLAQQNKDAFFSAHPNFKWYKLPAPPLRTLSTRPGNSERNLEDQEHEQQDQSSTSNKTQTGSYFKLADETQMGELNSLINLKNSNECPLQKALGETTHFLSAHIPSVGEIEFTVGSNDKQNGGKRRAIMENSFSSNSSEDDMLPKKSSRSCKGKIYQELVSSGQIAPIAKKSRSNKPNSMVADSVSDCYTAINATHGAFNAASYLHAIDVRCKSKRTVSESDISHHFGVEPFDLEERIKQLPALSLDAYLQRKRNTKKKKKFTARKRTSNSVSLPITEHRNAMVNKLPPKEIRNQVLIQQAVGSQKRKARKESITRRDISAIESEVASLIPLSTESNGCFYFNETPTSASNKLSSPRIIAARIVPASASASATTATATATNWQSPISVPLSTTTNVATSNATRAYGNFADGITTTSDLFILAEVAAKRTELTN